MNKQLIISTLGLHKSEIYSKPAVVCINLFKRKPFKKRVLGARLDLKQCSGNYSDYMKS